MFPNVQVGTYTITIQAPGFATYTRRGVEVNAARVTEVKANLTLGSATETIEVQSGAEVVQVSSSQLRNDFGGDHLVFCGLSRDLGAQRFRNEDC